jgi:hypothetical protein
MLVSDVRQSKGAEEWGKTKKPSRRERALNRHSLKLLFSV